MKRVKQATIILLMSLAAVSNMSAQDVTFYSSEFEEGVKSHLGLLNDDVVTQPQTDTITSIDLSGLGITDIRDVAYLANVKSLDLSYNKIRDVSPLLPLDSLRDVDLSGNLIESISLLSFANSDSMVVNVAYNYITDFSFLLTPSANIIRIAGMSAQKDKEASYMKIYQLFVNVNDEGKYEAFYRGYSNMNGLYMMCSGKQNQVTLDGEMRSVVMPGDLTKTTMVRLSNGTDDGDSTWVIPSKVYNVKGGERLTIATGLPSTYRIGSLNTQHGTVSTTGDAGLDIVYEAPAQAVDDAIYLSYYEGSKLRGFAQLNIADSPDYILGDINGDGVVDVSDYIGIANHILNYTPAGFNEKAADVNEDGVIDVSDYIGVANIILTGSIYGNQQQSRIKN